MVQTLEGLEPGDCLILNLPPRSSKTETLMTFIEHHLGKHTSDEVMFISYSGALAYQKSRYMRNQVRGGPAYKSMFPRSQLARDATKVSEWRLEGGGGLIASGVGGSLTGKGARIAIVDDPIKGRKSAESKVVRDGVIEFLKADVITRLEPDGILILTQTRWNVDDPSGWLQTLLENGDETLEGFKLKRLVIPALCDDPESDPLGREIGESYWPERWTAAKLKRNKVVLGEYDFAALYQQQPYARGGNLFKEPARYNRVGLSHLEWLTGFSPYSITITLDLAASKRRTADFTTFQVWAHQPALNAFGRRARVLEVRRGHWSITEILAMCFELQQRYGVMIRVESVMSQVAVVNHLEENGVWLERINPSQMGDKYARALQPAAAWNAGVIEVPITADWDVSAYLKEHLAFTGNDEGKDDQVDTTAYNWLFGTSSDTAPSTPSAGMATAATNTPASFYRAPTR